MRLIISVFALLLTGCATNPYANFYNGVPDARKEANYVPTSDQIRIMQSTDIDKDTKQLMVKGYVPIGQSSFNSGDSRINEQQVYEQAQKVGAQVVLTASKYTNTVSGSTPVVVPNVTQTYSSGSATAFGLGGTVNAYGSGNTTTYGSNTLYVPYSVRRSDYFALYFIKTKSKIGAYVEPIDDETKKKLQSNAGVRVFLVAEDTPAFDANILPGDILLTFDGLPIKSVENYQELIQHTSGQVVQLSIYRDGKTIKKKIVTN